MQIIPVFDIKGGILVHAVSGARREYRPLQTPLIPGPDPHEAAETLARLGFPRIYIADLDAITGSGNNLYLIRELLSSHPIQVWLDSGLVDAARLPLLDLPGISLIAGSETMGAIADLATICDQVGARRVIFSLDTKNGEVLTPDPALKGTAPVELAARVFAQGIEEMIVLDLKAVGTRAGLNSELLAQLVQKFPDKGIFPGGGLKFEDIARLKQMGIRGVLTATALYSQEIPAVPEI